MDLVEITCTYINQHPELRRLCTPDDLRMIEATASGQIMGQQCMSYFLQYLLRHCGKKENEPVTDERSIDYYDPDSMAFDLLTLLVKSRELRLHVGGDLLALITLVLTNPTHRYQFAIATMQEYRQWKQDGVPQGAWFSRLDHMPMLPDHDNAGAVLIRSGRGQSSDAISMEGLNRQFAPWTVLVHATNAAKPIFESGNFVTGREIDDEGRNLIHHFTPITAAVIQQWQEMNNCGDKSIQEWLRGNDVFSVAAKGQGLSDVLLR